MINIYNYFFSALESNKIPYCSWKNNHLLSKELMGDGDLDLLVHPQYKNLFERVLSEHGFIYVKGAISEYPFIYHYYGYDQESNSFAHLHVYYKLVTGDSHLKDYRIPFEVDILENAFINKFGIKEASIDHQMQLYLLRKTIKQSSLVGLFLLHRESDDYNQEYDYIRSQLTEPVTDNVFLGLLGRSFYFKNNTVPFLTRFILGAYMRPWHRKVGVVNRIKQLYIRIINKLFLHRKKSFNGSLVAIVGLDGSGKSTAVGMLQKWLNREFNVKVFHFGRPPATFLTWPVRVALYLRKMLGRNQPVASLGDTTKEMRLNLIGKLRYATLAYERSVLMKKAHRYSLNGGVSILDRYPSITIGLMDSPRIQPSNMDNKISNLLYQLESTLYKLMPPADLLFQFEVDVENALTRNRNRIKKDKETDDEIVMRFKLNKGLKYEAISLVKINANLGMSVVHKQLRNQVWKHIVATN